MAQSKRGHPPAFKKSADTFGFKLHTVCVWYGKDMNTLMKTEEGDKSL